MGFLKFLDELYDVFFNKPTSRTLRKRIKKRIGGKMCGGDALPLEFDYSLEFDVEFDYIKARKERKLLDTEKEKRIQEWPNIKDQIFAKYQIQIADDAKPIAERIYGKSLDSLPVFFITDERVIRKRYIDGGMGAIAEYADNLTNQSFVGAPITATFLTRLEALNKAKLEGDIIDTDIDIDGFSPNAKIQYTLKDVNLDGQRISARRKISPKCEMTSTLTEGFRVGPFVVYDELYYCTKGEMEMTVEEAMDKDMNKNMNIGMERNNINTKTNNNVNKMNNEDNINIDIDICPHGTDKKLYCNQCHGDIIIKGNRKVIGICLDITGSMQGMKLRAAKIAVARVLNSIPVDRDIDVVISIFSSDIKEKFRYIIPYGTKFTQEIKEIAIEKISYLTAGGNTPLYSAINDFMDKTWSLGSLDDNKIFFPYTYLIIVSDGEENHSRLYNLIYGEKKDEGAFFEKLKAYRDAGLITEIIPFAYGNVNDRYGIQLIRDLQSISGKILVNETDPDRIVDMLIGTVDSILYGENDLKMMGIPVSKKRDKISAMM